MDVTPSPEMNSQTQQMVESAQSGVKQKIERLINSLRYVLITRRPANDLTERPEDKNINPTKNDGNGFPWSQ